MELDNRRFLPLFQPEIPGDPAVVLIHPPIALPPVVKLAGSYDQPEGEASNADLGSLRSDQVGLCLGFN